MFKIDPPFPTAALFYSMSSETDPAVERFTAWTPNWVEAVQQWYEDLTNEWEQNGPLRETLVREALMALPPYMRPKEFREVSREGDSKLKNPPKGEFIFTLRRGAFAWKVQLIASEQSNGTRTPTIRFQLWTWGKDRGFPHKGEPAYGFGLNSYEAKKLLAALQDSLARIESGDFDPDDEKNITRWSKK